MGLFSTLMIPPSLAVPPFNSVEDDFPLLHSPENHMTPPPHSPLHPPGDEQELVPKTIFCHIIFYKALKFELILCRRVYTTWQK